MITRELLIDAWIGLTMTHREVSSVTKAQFLFDDVDVDWDASYQRSQLAFHHGQQQQGGSQNARKNRDKYDHNRHRSRQLIGLESVGERVAHVGQQKGNSERGEDRSQQIYQPTDEYGDTERKPTL